MFSVCFVLTLHTHADFLEVQEKVHNVLALPGAIYDKQSPPAVFNGNWTKHPH